MNNIQTILIAIIVSLVVGFGTGWVVQSKFTKAGIVDAVKQIDKQSDASNSKSVEVENLIEKEKQKSEVQYRVVIKEITKYVPETIVKECKTQDGVSVATTLSVGAVSVLSTDSETPYIQPTNGAESEKPTEVGLRELSEYILEIKKQYGELAIEHDGLMDYNAYYKALINQQ